MTSKLETWRVEGRRGPGYIISAGVNAEGDGPARYVGVLDPMFHIAGETAQIEKDVALAIAAPGMREALAKIQELARPGQQLDISAAIDVLCDIWNVARVAAAKAEGRA